MTSLTHPKTFSNLLRSLGLCGNLGYSLLVVKSAWVLMEFHWSNRVILVHPPRTKLCSASSCHDLEIGTVRQHMTRYEEYRTKGTNSQLPGGPGREKGNPLG